MPYMGVCSGFFHILKAKGLEAVKSSCYNTEGNLKIADGICKLCEEKGYSITQALLGFFGIQDFDVLPLAELVKTLSMEFDAKDYGFLK